jgi:hypothetical protein
VNFSELKTELSDRGFSYLSDTRLGRYINNARAELDDTDLWPYREEFTTGAAPLSISDLGTIEAVLDERDQPLIPGEYRDLVSVFGDISTAGTPTHYYIANPSGTLQVATYPTSSETIQVQYWEVTPDLSLSSDTPLAPTRFHKLIVDMAVRECYRDADNHEAAEALQVQIDRDLWRMREALLVQTTQGPQSHIQITERW